MPIYQAASRDGENRLILARDMNAAGRYFWLATKKIATVLVVLDQGDRIVVPLKNGITEVALKVAPVKRRRRRKAKNGRKVKVAS